MKKIILTGSKVFAMALVASLVLTSCKCDRKKQAEAAASSSANTAAGTGTVVEEVTPNVVAGAYDPTTNNFIIEVGENIVVDLPNGEQMTVGANSTEANLIERLSDPSYQADNKEDWFSFDRVYFETGKSTLTADSKSQLANIAQIMKAYPTSAIKIGGYTDNTGDAAINTKVSTERANTVMKELETLGITADRLGAEGYGPEFPICPANDTPECQAMNRRVDMRVTAK